MSTFLPPTAIISRMSPNKWHRIAISAAGIWIDLLIASTATFVWWYTEPGLLNSFCLNLMFVCSVSTLVFNANPLLRFDGYYVLSDLLEIPNLAQKSAKLMRRTLASVCLGIEPADDPFLPQRSRGLFAVYSVAAFVYRWMITFSILWFLTQVFKPYGLQVIGYLIALFTLSTMAVIPLWKLFRYLKTNWPSNAPTTNGNTSMIKRSRLQTTICVASAILLVVVGIPLPRTVLCPLEVQPHGAVSVYVGEPGVLEAVYVEPGERVAAGALLAVLSNPQVESAIAELTSQRDRLQTELMSLRRRSFESPSLAGGISTIEKRLHAVEKQLDVTTSRRLLLKVVAPRAGLIASAPAAATVQRDSDELASPQGDPLLPQNLGSWLEKGTQLCLIAPEDRHEASLVIHQSDIESVQPGQTVTIRLDHLPGETLTGEIDRIATEEMESVSLAMSARGGGSVATVPDASGRSRPQAAHFQAIVPLPVATGPLQAGLRGQARIVVDPATLGSRLWSELQSTFRIRL